MYVFVTMLLTSLILYWLFSSSKKPPTVDKATGSTVFRFGKPFLIIGIVVGIVLPLGICFLATKSRLETDGDVYALVGMLAGVGVPGIYVLLLALRFKVTLNGSTLTINRILFGRRVLHWNEIVRVSYSSFFSWLSIKDNRGRRIRINVFIGGFSDLVKTLQRYLPNSVFTIKGLKKDGLGF